MTQGGAKSLTRSGALVGTAPIVGMGKYIRSIQLVVQRVEPILGFCLRFRM